MTQWLLFQLSTTWPRRTPRPTSCRPTSACKTALTRLSSGLRINSSGDDAAGLAVANSYRSKVAVLNQGIRNANDGLSTLQIKDGALNNISNLLDRLSTLATQSASSVVQRRPHQAEHRVQVGLDAKSTVKRPSPASTTAKPASRCSSATTARNGIVGGTIASADTAPAASTSPRLKVDSAFNARGRGGHHRDGGRPARHRAGQRRCAREPSPVRHRPGAVAVGQQPRRPRAGFAMRTSRKSRPT